MSPSDEPSSGGSVSADDPADVRVVVVGGPPGAGKTTLARALAVELGWDWLSGDDLVVAARAMTSVDGRPELHPMAGHGHTAYFTDTAPERLIADSMALGHGLWPALRRVIEFRVSASRPAVVDWWLFSPAQIADLRNPRVASIWLHIDHNELWRRERANHDFTSASSNPERMLANFMERSLWRNRLILDEATAAGLTVVGQPGDRSVEQLVGESLDVLGLGPQSRPG